jgi:simple sugar transport system ATP-binding protein
LVTVREIGNQPPVDGSTPAEPPVLEVLDLAKSFGAVRALRGVSLTLNKGEVLGLLGDNGAGKSTFVKCLVGVVRPDSGTILVNGKEVHIHNPEEARLAGIEAVHQNLDLVPQLDVAANLFLNREITNGPWPLRSIGWLNKRHMYRQAREVLDRFHVRIPSVRVQVDQLSGGQRQAIAVSRAVEWSREIILLDEPTAALGVEQSETILNLILKLSEEGLTVLLISHNMQHVVEVCHRAIVLRHGEKVGDVMIKDVSPADLVDLITGAARGSAGKPGENGNGESEEAASGALPEAV